jgi:hypothetical protein
MVVAMDTVAKMMVAASGGCWSDNGGGHNVGAIGMDCNDGGQGTEMAGKGNAAGRDCGAQHGGGFGHGAYRHWLLGVQTLFTCFIYGLVKKVKE